MKAQEIRTRFLGFFRERGHEIVKSSSLIPQSDPTLLFANAGMNQFKDVFLGNEKRAIKRAASVQKCLRAGGKHNDLDNVGHTNRHHTFFEMLGNFSFGDYFKEDAIAMAWDLMTAHLGLPSNRLYATVFRDDDQAWEIWHRKIGVPENRILRFDEKDNFWAMGETGPCGPCSEILYDQGPDVGCRRPTCGPGCFCDRYLELWNLVFMQFERDTSGRVTPLPSPCIDTGAGLERITAVLQGATSNFHTDLFLPIIREVSETSGVEYDAASDAGAAMRVVADHIRASTFVISDGALPSNEGRGFVLRKILRRAMRYGRKLGLEEPFLFKLVGTVIEIMGDAYPELVGNRDHAARIIQGEEERFASTLTLGLKMLEKVCNESRDVVAGGELFKLYDTYGFPLDLARDYCEERGVRIDEAGFNRELDHQRERARAAARIEEEDSEESALLKEYPRPAFIGYETLRSTNSRIIAVFRDGRSVDRLKEGEVGRILIDPNPFYAESGGQIGDRGMLLAETGRAVVQMTSYHGRVYPLLDILIAQGSLEPGQEVDAAVDVTARQDTSIHHTATHLLNAALREVIGPHVKQSGSLVDPHHLRFDFSHYAPLKDRELADIEELVNMEIRRNEQVQIKTLPIEDALKAGALAFFGDKYGSHVRVIRVGDFSMELCGGTHLKATGQIGLFHIESEGSVASGIRRITARAGAPAFQSHQRDRATLRDIEQTLRTTREDLSAAVARLQETLKHKDRELNRLKQKTLSTIDLAEGTSQMIDGTRVVNKRLDGCDMPALRTVMDRWREQIGSGIIVLASQSDDKALLLVGVTKDLTKRFHAGKIVKKLAGFIGGSGGGRPDLAEAGGKEPGSIDKMLGSILEALGEASR